METDDLNSQDNEKNDGIETDHKFQEEDIKRKSEDSLKYPSHFLNKGAHRDWIRYGIPIYLLAVFSLLFASDIASGFKAEVHISSKGELLRLEEVIELNIFTSVSELWRAKSYALAILISIASICWPYIKLMTTMFVWVVPWQSKNSRRREIMLEILDACSKWSLVDLFLLFVVMVGFRTTVEVSAVKFDIYIQPQKGLSGFVAASILSLLSSHVVLYLHRKVIYEDEILDKKKDLLSVNEEIVEPSPTEKQKLFQRTGSKSLLVLFLSNICLILFCIGYFVETLIFTYENETGYSEKTISLREIGITIADATSDPHSFSIRWLQTVFMIMSIAVPLCSPFVYIILYLTPMTVIMQKNVLFLAEIISAWNAIDVLALSVVMSVWQIPKIGTGLIETGCSECFIINSRLKWTFVFTAVGSASHMACCYYLNIIANRTLHRTKIKNPSQ